MCVVAIAWRVSDDWPLVMVGNRDELHARPSAPMGRWDDRSGLIAGQDLISGGTWLGLTEAGALGVVTNRRSERPMDPEARSRGLLLADWLSYPSEAALDGLGGYNPVNLALISGERAEVRTNWPEVRRRPMEAGVFGLSNGDVDEPSTRVEALRPAVEAWLALGGDVEPLFEALRREEPTASPLPHAVFGPAPVFMLHPIYGTRCSTVIVVDNDGRGRAIERSFDAEARRIGEVAIEFRWG